MGPKWVIESHRDLFDISADPSKAVAGLAGVPIRQILLPVIAKRNRRAAKVVVVPEVVSELPFEGSDFRPQRPMFSKKDVYARACGLHPMFLWRTAYMSAYRRSPGETNPNEHVRLSSPDIKAIEEIRSSDRPAEDQFPFKGMVEFKLDSHSIEQPRALSKGPPAHAATKIKALA